MPEERDSSPSPHNTSHRSCSSGMSCFTFYGLTLIFRNKYLPKKVLHVRKNAPEFRWDRRVLNPTMDRSSAPYENTAHPGHFSSFGDRRSTEINE